VYRVLVGKPEGKRPLGRPRHRRWEDNNIMDLQETVLWHQIFHTVLFIFKCPAPLPPPPPPPTQQPVQYDTENY
jgi:hypothetical protein